MSNTPVTPAAPEDPLAQARASMMYWHERAMAAEKQRDELAAVLREWRREFGSADSFREDSDAKRMLERTDAILARIKEGKR